LIFQSIFNNRRDFRTTAKIIIKPSVKNRPLTLFRDGKFKKSALAIRPDISSNSNVEVNLFMGINISRLLI